MTDKKFMDPGPIRDPDLIEVTAQTADELFPVDGVTDTPSSVTPPTGAPCADCARNAQIAMYVGCGLGVAVGVVAAWIILRNRLAPVAS